MGNTLSPFLANIFLSHLETKLQKEIKDFSKAQFRYVNQILCIIQNDFNINKFLVIMNNMHPSTKFTHELEQQNKIPFLDIMIIRHPNHLEFNIYRKATDTNNYIPSNSFQP